MYSSLRYITPDGSQGPTTELLTLGQAKQHLRVDNDSDDDLIADLVTTSRMLVEMWSGRAFLTQTLVYTFSQDPPTGGLPLLPMPLLILPVILTAPQVMNKPIEMPRSPVQSVTSVIETDTDGTPNTLDPSQYIVDTAVDPCRVRLNWLTVPRYMQHIAFTFIAGYGDTPDTVPAPFRSAVKLMLGYLYENRGDADMPDRPPKAIDWLIAPLTVKYFGG